METLDERMKNAGMLTIDEMIERLGANPFMLQREVHDLESFEWWLEMKYREFLSMQAKYQLDNKENDELFEWVLAHAALFGTVLAHYRKVKNNGS